MSHTQSWLIFGALTRHGLPCARWRKKKNAGTSVISALLERASAAGETRKGTLGRSLALPKLSRLLLRGVQGADAPRVEQTPEELQDLRAAQNLNRISQTLSA